MIAFRLKKLTTPEWPLAAIIIGLQLLIFLYLLNIFFKYTPDDGYIYLYGARQLARGYLPNMTPGETPTNAFASLLWVILLAPGYLLPTGLIVWGKLLGVFILVGVWVTVATLLKFWRQDTSWLAALALAGTLLCFPPLIAVSANLLETILASITLLVALYFTLRDMRQTKMSYLTGLALGIHLLSRPDNFLDVSLMIAALLLACWQSGNFKQSGWGKLIVGMLPPLLFGAGVMLIYDQILPNSAAAKYDRMIGQHGIEQQGLILYIWQEVITVIYRLLSNFMIDGVLFLVYLSLLLFLWTSPHKPSAGLVVALALTHLAIFLIFGDWMGLHRLWMPSLLVGYTVFLSTILKFSQTKQHLYLILFLLIFMLPASKNGWMTYLAFHYATPGSPAEQLGRLIYQHKLPNSWLMTEDMGIIPYFADIPTIDASDQPIANRQRLANPEDVAYVRHHPLDFVILITPEPAGEAIANTAINNLMIKSEWFQQEYVKVATATWRPQIEDFQRRGLFVGEGRYFHLYVSRRIETLRAQKLVLFP